MNRLFTYATYAVFATAIVVLAAILLATLIIGFASLEAGASLSILTQLVQPFRAYLFRNALGNTLLVLAIALPLTYLLGLAAVTLMAQNQRSRGVMAWLLLLPLAMPLALALPAWHQIFAASPALAGRVFPAMVAMGLIQAWRLLPFAALFLLLARPLQQKRGAIGLLLCFSAYVVVADVAVPLLLTGGAPYNATHLLASWLYQTAVAAALPAQAALLGAILIAPVAVLAWGIAHYAAALSVALQTRYARLDPGVIAATRRRRPPPSEPRRRRGFVTSADHTPQAFGGVLLASPVIIVLLLPISVPLVMTGDMALWPAALGQLFGQLHYGYWLANTILLAGLTALVTVLAAIPAGLRLALWDSPWSSRLTSAIGILGLTALAIAFLPLAWLQARQPLGDSRWLLASIYGSVGLCIGVWLVALVNRGQIRVQRSALTSWLVLLSYLLVTNEMAAALALSNGLSRAQGLNSGLVTGLVFDTSMARPVIGLGILIPFALLLLLYWWLVRAAIAPLVEWSDGPK